MNLAFVQKIPNHAAYETTIIAMKNMMSTLTAHPSQIKRWCDLHAGQ